MIQMEQADFNVFEVDGLEERMTALIAQIRPKLQRIGDLIAPTWQELTGIEAHIHVAKHARRSVNPPNDTWVAWSSNKRGYKALPHLQFGLWKSHVFLQFAVIYECPGKATIGDALWRERESLLSSLPAHFRWSNNHMVPHTVSHEELTEEQLREYCERLRTVKSSELLIGIRIDATEAIQMSPDSLERTIREALQLLAPIQRLAYNHC